MGKNLEAALSRLKKQFNDEGVVFRLGDGSKIAVSVIPSGLLALDRALGVGGLPRGRVIEIFGPESGGKTTIALKAIAQAQAGAGGAKPKKCAFIDAEHALDPDWAAKLGVNTDDLLVCQPDYGEQALEVAEGLIRSGEMDIIVVDSVAALTPKNEIEGEVGDAQMGLQARMMSQSLRKLTGVLSKSDTILIFINQLRKKIGVMFGNPETTTGGEALKFYASIRLDVRRVQAIKDGDQPIGARTRIKVIKNKVAAPHKDAEFNMLFGQGIDTTSDLIETAVALGVIVKEGSWYSYGEQRWQGKAALAADLTATAPELFFAPLTAAVREKINA
jgi:recombination protein RecA